MQKDSKMNSKGKKTTKKPSKKGKPGTKNGNIAKRARAAVNLQAQNSHFNKAENMSVVNPHLYDKAADQLSRGLYTDEILPKVEELASKGLNNNEIAAALCIGNRTFYEWRERYPQFAHSIKKYRGLADIQVENALFQSAIGGSFKEVKSERRYNKQEQKFEIVVTEEVIKHIPGNSTAQIFYLKNRMPHRYKDKVETMHELGDRMSQMFFSLKRRED